MAMNRHRTPGHQPRQGRLAHARRPHRIIVVRLAGLERDAQRAAIAQQVPGR